MSNVGFVEVDWEAEVEVFECVAVIEEIEDGKVMLDDTFEDDCGVLIGKAVCEATDRNAVFVASMVVVPVVEE
jgi:hypothetical protein